MGNVKHHFITADNDEHIKQEQKQMWLHHDMIFKEHHCQV